MAGIRKCRKCGVLFSTRHCKVCVKSRKEKWVAIQIASMRMRPCRKCGALFNTINCKACDKVRRAIRRIVYPEAQRLATEKFLSSRPGYKLIVARKYRAAHPEKIKAYTAKRYAENSVNLLAKTAKWRAEHPDVVRIYNQNRRAMKKYNGGKLSRDIREKLFVMQNGKCACCDTMLRDNYHLDHIMPLALGGANDDSNVQLLTATCNMQKNAKHPVDFMKSRGLSL